MTSYADLEPLVDDDRVEKIRSRFLRRRPDLDPDSVFVTYIQPPMSRVVGDEEVVLPEVACFAVISRNPKGGADVMTVGSTWLEVFRAEDKRKSHYVYTGDILERLYKPVVASHIQTINNLRDMGHSTAESIR